MTAPSSRPDRARKRTSASTRSPGSAPPSRVRVRWTSSASPAPGSGITRPSPRGRPRNRPRTRGSDGLRARPTARCRRSRRRPTTAPLPAPAGGRTDRERGTRGGTGLARRPAGSAPATARIRETPAEVAERQTRCVQGAVLLVGVRVQIPASAPAFSRRRIRVRAGLPPGPLPAWWRGPPGPGALPSRPSDRHGARAAASDGAPRARIGAGGRSDPSAMRLSAPARSRPARTHAPWGTRYPIVRDRCRNAPGRSRTGASPRGTFPSGRHSGGSPADRPAL